MTKNELKNRTKSFALLIIKLVNDLPDTRSGNVIGNQLINPELLLQPIIGLPAGQGAKPILSQKFVSLKKRVMNQFSGLN